MHLCAVIISHQRKSLKDLKINQKNNQKTEVIISNDNRQKNNRSARQEETHRINEKIKATQVRLVGEEVEQGIFDTKKALAMAQEKGLDLVEISPNADPPVCRITDFSKFKYDQKKKQKELKAKAMKVVVKEIRFGPNTDDHDFDFKMKHAQEFLKEGSKVRAYVQFVGRSIVFKERGELLLLRFAQGLEDLGKLDQTPKLEGKRMGIMITPKVVPTKK